MGKVVSSDWYTEQIVKWTQDGIFTLCHQSCRIPDRYMDSPLASQVIVAGLGSGALYGPGP